MGIVLNGGVRYPNVTVREMRFAQNTPVETVLQREPHLSQRVLSPEIAALVRQELIAVVEKGTGRRAHGGIMLHDRTVIPIGVRLAPATINLRYLEGMGARSDLTLSIVLLLSRSWSVTVSLGPSWRSFLAKS